MSRALLAASATRLQRGSVQAETAQNAQVNVTRCRFRALIVVSPAFSNDLFYSYLQGLLHKMGRISRTALTHRKASFKVRTECLSLTSGCGHLRETFSRIIE